MVLIALYIEDLIIYSSSIGVIKKVKEILESEFEMKNFCEVSALLGLKIEVNKRKEKIRIFQKNGIEKVLKYSRLRIAKQSSHDCHSASVGWGRIKVSFSRM